LRYRHGCAPRGFFTERFSARNPEPEQFTAEHGMSVE
jgi:hypothetical protein